MIKLFGMDIILCDFKKCVIKVVLGVLNMLCVFLVCLILVWFIIIILLVKVSVLF